MLSGKQTGETEGYLKRVILVLHPDRNQSFEPSDLRHCVVKISRQCHRIAVKILPGTGTNHAAHNSDFCLDGAPGKRAVCAECRKEMGVNRE